MYLEFTLIDTEVIIRIMKLVVVIVYLNERKLKYTNQHFHICKSFVSF